MAQLQAMIGTVCSTMQPIALVMLTIWLAFVGADIAFGHKTLPAACKDFAVAACVIVLLQAGQYTQYISNLFLTAVPTHHRRGAWRRYDFACRWPWIKLLNTGSEPSACCYLQRHCATGAFKIGRDCRIAVMAVCGHSSRLSRVTLPYVHLHDGGHS